MKLNYTALATWLLIGVVGIYLVFKFKDKVGLPASMAGVGQSANQFVKGYGYEQKPQSPLGFPSESAQYADFMWQLYHAQQNPTDLLKDPFIKPRYGGGPEFFGGKVWVNQNGKVQAIGTYSNEAVPGNIIH